MAATRTVFVSHAHADNELCDRYVAALRARGLDVWYDRNDMQDGRALSAVIETELRTRTAFVVLLTQAAINSYWVSLEIAAYRHLVGQDPTRLMVPVRIAPCEVPLLMTGIKWIDAYALPFEHATDAIVKSLSDVPQADQARGHSTASGAGVAESVSKDSLAQAPGDQQPVRGDDLGYELTVSFEEAVRGCHKEIDLPRWEVCPTCGGSRARPGTSTPTCPTCLGTGEVRRILHSNVGDVVNMLVCNRCGGAGKLITTPCDRCAGKGRLSNIRRITVNVPAGVDDGITVRIAGEGEMAPIANGVPGDLYVTLKVRPHPYLRRKGLDILYDATLSRQDAMRGTTIVVPTVDGYEPVVVPPIAQSGTTLRLPGKGAPEVTGTKRGDEVVTIVVA